MTIVSQVFDHVIGVDTHAKTHTLVVLDSHGAKQAGETFPTSPAGLKRAHAWMLRLGVSSRQWKAPGPMAPS